MPENLLFEKKSIVRDCERCHVCSLVYVMHVMFVGIIAVNPHETITRPLGGPRGLKACCIC